jgi:hypothetical protein
MTPSRPRVLSVCELLGLSEYTVETRLAGDVFAPVSQERHNLSRREVAKLGQVRRRQNERTLGGGECVRRRRNGSMTTILFATRNAPTRNASRGETEQGTGFLASRSAADSLVDEFDDQSSFFRPVSSSSSTQMA